MRTCVVTGGGGPPFRVIEREGLPFIVVNDYDKGEMPRPRSKRLASSLPTAPGQRRRMKLPAAEVHTRLGSTRRWRSRRKRDSR
ncbi:hypothetical protein DIPPA_27206 [Diplonema papillatum]|nr:hypothetical protein DIPPA_27206 [Diplonema papillatum]